MNLFIKIYILLSIALIIFDLAFLAVKQFKNSELYPRNSKLENSIRKEIALRRKTNSFSPNFLKTLSLQLTQTKNLITLHSVLETEPDTMDWFRTTIYEKIDVYLKKTDYEQAFYTYVISCFDYSEEEIPPYFLNRLLTLLNSTSLYTFSNTMNALYRFGQVNLMMLAIDKADERGKFYHKKLLTDGILASRVDLKELTAKLTERFYQYSPHMQECLLDIFRMGNGDASQLCMELIHNHDLDEQVRYSAMRYFSKHPCESSRKFFLRILKNNDAAWVEQMLAIQCLGCYRDGDIYQAVKDKATSRHWYVRTNAMEYLHRQGISCEEIAEILHAKDKYASEALLYQYRDDHEMTMFIIRTIQEIEQNAMQTQGSPAPAEDANCKEEVASSV